MGVTPVVYGQSSRPPRGDYSRAASDFTCTQNYAAYTEADHATWRQLYVRQSALLPGRACSAFMACLPQLDAAERIPQFDAINARLQPTTGWQVVGVPGLIPEVDFFRLLSQRRFPVTDWIRTPQELDYIVEPDIFHDLFGHVPLLFNPVLADFMQAYGEGGLKAAELGATELLARVYWYTIEFGLIREADGVRAYGAGILSSAGELAYSVESPTPHRLPLTLQRAMRTRYRIDDYQPTYFVIDELQQLLDFAQTDFAPLYTAVQALPHIDAATLLAGEITVPLAVQH